jgi:hypothetical protein
MDAMRHGAGLKSPWAKFAAITTIAMLAVVGLFFAPSYAQQAFVTLSAGVGAPGASGEATIRLTGGVAAGEIEVNNLPPQAFGSGHFYGVWFVRSDTGDKAFLGAIIRKESIILSTGGNGEMKFSATHFTTGPNAGSSITFGPAGSNVIIVLIESAINGLTPSPIGPVPGTGVAVVGAF